MSTKTYTAGAAAVAQVNTFTFAGTWTVGDNITFTYGSATWTYTIASATIATFLASLQTAYAALGSGLYPQFYEQICTNPTGSTLVFTARSAGVPFTLTVATNSAAGTIDGVTSTTGVATTASSGPNDWSIGANWNTGTIPANGDDVILTGTSNSLLYGMAQSGVTLNSLTIDSSFTGLLGLAANNPTGYSEYRTAYLSIGATTVTIGAGSDAGSQRLKINFGSVQTAVSIISTNTSPFDPNVASVVLLEGSNSSNTLSLTQASVTSSMTLATLLSGYNTVVNTDVNLVQTGAVTTLTQNGGTINCSGNVGTWTVNAGVPTLSGTATCTTLKVLTAANAPLTFTWTGTGTITTVTLSAGAKLDCSKNASARTLTNCNLEGGAIINDPAVTITFSNPFYLRACGVQDVTLILGRDIHLQRS